MKPRSPWLSRPGPTCAVLGLALVVTRLLLLLGLDQWVHGVEFTGDVANHWSMVRDPFRLLVGHTTPYGQYPLLEALIARPLHAMTSASPFVVMRVTYLVYEALAAALLCYVVRKHAAEAPRGKLYLVLLLGPMGWLTSTVMAQDETIAGLALTLVVWLIASGRYRAAIVTGSLAVAAVKVFFILPLAAMVGFLPSPKPVQRVGLALAPVGGVYLVVVGAALARGEPLPFAGFIPRPDYGVNLWALAMVKGGWSPVSAAWVSGLSVLVAAGVVLVAARRAGPKSSDWTWWAGVCSALFLWTWGLFYHVNPEYYVLPVLGLLLLPLSPGRLVWIGFLSVCPWMVNLTFGLQRMVGSSGGLGERGLVSGWLSEPVLQGMHTLSALANSIVTILAALMATRLVKRYGQGKIEVGTVEMVRPRRS